MIWRAHTEPNHGNGYDHEKYSWTQTLAELTLHIPLPEGTKSKNVLCDIKMKSLQAGLKGQPPILKVRDKLSLYDHNTYLSKLCGMVFIFKPFCDNKGHVHTCRQVLRARFHIPAPIHFLKNK